MFRKDHRDMALDVDFDDFVCAACQRRLHKLVKEFSAAGSWPLACVTRT